MKKFDLRGVKGVFATLRGSEKSSAKGEFEVPESLQPHDFYCGKLTRHGFPYQPTCMAWDPIQKLLAVGTKHGVVRLLGKPGVEVTMQHNSETIVLHVKFLINQGALITVCSDNYVNLWSYRQKVPEIVHSLTFCRERITCLYLAYQSKWLYLGTERGNVHVVNVETFTVCGYTINWNKAIELSRKTHPGPVVHLSDNPMDPNKLLIGFETGLVVCWDLRCKMAECRFNSSESLRDCSWSNEGKLFMCSYADGTLSTWSIRQQAKPVSVMTPHAKATKSGQLSPCKPINRLEWKSMKSGEPHVIFSGGMSYDASKSPCLTIMHGKDVTVLEMEHKILDFIVLCRNMWSYEYDDPYAIIVLLASDLIFIDMTIPGYPCFQCPYALDIHESPVTCLKYISDCASDLIPAIYSCGTKQIRKGFSTKEFPVSGGTYNLGSCSYTELLITGHADGSIKFWDVSGTTIQILYRLKSSKQFEKVKRKYEEDEDVLAIQHIYLDEESRQLAVAASHHIVIYGYSKKEVTLSVPVVVVPAISELVDEDNDSPSSPTASRMTQNYSNNMAEHTNNISKPSVDTKEVRTGIKAKLGSRKYNVGYQPELVVLVQWYEGTTPPNITSLCINSSYGMMAAGTTTSIFIIDTVQKTCLLNIHPAELCNSEIGRLATPTVSSPKKRLPSASSSEQEYGRISESGSEANSRSTEQMSSLKHDEEHLTKVSKSPQPEMNEGSTTSLSDLQASTKSPSNHSLTPSNNQVLLNNGEHKHMTKSSPELDKVNAANLDAPPSKVSWARRLSTKVGTIAGLSLNKHKSSSSVKSHSATPSSQNSLGFFTDQKSNKRSRTDKTDGGAFSRSRSPSNSSLDVSAHQPAADVMFLTFADSYSRKLNEETMSSLWIGTSAGTLMALDVIPYYSERNTKPIMLAHSGSTFQLKGTILELCFLNCKGFLVPVEAEIWGNNKESTGEKRGKRLVSRVSRLSMSSADSSMDKSASTDQQQHIAVMVSDSEMRAVSLPSQSVLTKEKFPDGMFVVKATAIIMKESACLACLGSNGNLMVYSLPSLRSLLNVSYFNTFDVRAIRTFHFSNHGHALYMCTANEIQKVTVSADMCRAQADMQCEPFLAKENPEPPKQNFLKSLFGSGPSVLDREELFGTAGKASHGVAKFVPGAAFQAAQAGASGVGAELARTRMALDERGEKLGRLEDRSEAMKERAKEFSQNAAILADKYKNLKWYQL